MWEKHKNLKSFLLNHENPHFKYKSGDNLDDALDRAKNNLLLYKQNKLIMTNNKKMPKIILSIHPNLIICFDSAEHNPTHLLSYASHYYL